jgi:hypothetical protein
MGGKKPFTFFCRVTPSAFYLFALAADRLDGRRHRAALCLINVFALRKQNLIGRVCALPVRTQQTDERRRPAQPVVEAFIFSDIVNLLFSIHPSSHPAGKKKKNPPARIALNESL